MTVVFEGFSQVLTGIFCRLCNRHRSRWHWVWQIPLALVTLFIGFVFLVGEMLIYSAMWMLLVFANIVWNLVICDIEDTQRQMLNAWRELT